MAHYGIKVTTIVPGVVRTQSAAKAMTGNGELLGPEKGVMKGGLSVDEAIAIIMPQLAEGADEIIVAAGGEVQLMRQKREDPVAIFRFMEAAAEEEVYSDTGEQSG